MDKIDKLISERLKENEIEKNAIASIVIPKPRTNCSFSFKEDGGERINLHTINDIDKIVSMYVFLLQKEHFLEIAQNELDIQKKYLYLGYSISDWKHDLLATKLRIHTSERKRILEMKECEYAKEFSEKAQRINRIKKLDSM